MTLPRSTLGRIECISSTQPIKGLEENEEKANLAHKLYHMLTTVILHELVKIVSTTLKNWLFELRIQFLLIT